MHTEVEFDVAVKEAAGKGAARKVRAAGMVPGVLYGYKAEPKMVTFEERSLVKALSTPAGRNVFLKFKCEDSEIDGTRALIKDLQVHPLKRRFVHADFFKLDPAREIQTALQIRLEGEAKGVKLGGIMQIARHDMEVSCLPDDLPEAIVIDVTGLGIGQSIHIGDIEPPKGVKFLQPSKLALCAVVSPNRGAAAATEAEEGEGEAGAVEAAE